MSITSFLVIYCDLVVIILSQKFILAFRAVACKAHFGIHNLESIPNAQLVLQFISRLALELEDASAAQADKVVMSLNLWFIVAGGVAKLVFLHQP